MFEATFNFIKPRAHNKVRRHGPSQRIYRNTQKMKELATLFAK